MDHNLKNLLFLVREVFENLTGEFYKGITYNVKFPCVKCIKEKSDDISTISSHQIKMATKLNSPFIQCKKKFHILSTNELKGILANSVNDGLLCNISVCRYA